MTKVLAFFLSFGAKMEDSFKNGCAPVNKREAVAL
jgi:hypothetical protein